MSENNGTAPSDAMGLRVSLRDTPDAENDEAWGS